MFTTGWPTHILKTNIQDNEYCTKLFDYLISKYSNDWPNSFSQEDILTHPKHKHEILDKAGWFIYDNVKWFFQKAFSTVPKHFVKTFATSHQTIGLHQHSGSLISGVFYVFAEDGELILHDPRLNAQRGYPNVMQDYFKPVRLQPKMGDIIIFPSFLQHEVPNNNTKTTRVLMPFDVFGDLDHFGEN